jgi:hypothetical protein
MSDLAVVSRSIKGLEREPRNARRHPKKQIRQIAGSMEIDPRYVDATVRCWERVTGKKAIRTSENEALRSAPAVAKLNMKVTDNGLTPEDRSGKDESHDL